MANKHIDEPTGVETVGHEWDGIEELNNPLPRWWVIVFGLTVLFSLGYVVVYPAIPLLHSATAGVWNWSSRGQLKTELQAATDARKDTLAAIAATPIDQLMTNPKLLDQAKAGGAAAFKQNCAQCHGSGGKGGNGYPNLTDNDWLWGGSITDIQTTITHGIRSPGDAATRMSAMPNFGKDGILTAAQVADVAGYVRSLSGSAPMNASGKAVFEANCVVCHGPEGKGGRQVGAPNLTDQIWLYGGNQDQVVASVTKAHAGVMPAWEGKLDPVTIKMLAAYVHSLGGGEKFETAPTTPANGTGNAKP